MAKRVSILIGLLGICLIGLGIYFNYTNSDTKDDNNSFKDTNETEDEYRLLEESLERDELCNYMKQYYSQFNGLSLEGAYCQFTEGDESLEYELILSSQGITNKTVTINREELLAYIIDERSKDN